MSHVNFPLANYGTRHEGDIVVCHSDKALIVSAAIGEALTENITLSIDFQHINSCTVSFLKGMLVGLEYALLRRRDENCRAVIINAYDDAQSELELVHEHFNFSPIALRNPDNTIGLLTASPSPKYEATFSLGQQATEERGSFTIPELAETLDLKLPAINHHLSVLSKLGAVGREINREAPRGKLYNYQAVVPSMLPVTG